MLCGGQRYTPADPNLKGGYYMTPCVLGETRSPATLEKTYMINNEDCRIIHPRQPNEGVPAAELQDNKINLY